MLKTKGVQIVMIVFFMLLMCSNNEQETGHLKRRTSRKIKNYDHLNFKEFAFDYHDCYMPCHFHCVTD
jgi:hypothetical protein